MIDRETKIVNLTGDKLVLMDPEWTYEFPVNGSAVVKSRMRQVERLVLDDDKDAECPFAIPLLEVTQVDVRGLPGEVAGVLYVVNGATAEYALDVLGRMDVVCPSRARRGKDGAYIGRALARIRRV